MKTNSMSDLNITKPRYSKQILPVPWPFVISKFHCTFPASRGLSRRERPLLAGNTVLGFAIEFCKTFNMKVDPHLGLQFFFSTVLSLLAEVSHDERDLC